ncbi:hypothetical protein [Lysinibacillus sp. LZ02]|uniref:hypothetical protein n=1 Tax=Lysinibacillus sp. LZ02 TaxID=3420668 RepID=UPI003D35C30C
MKYGLSKYEVERIIKSSLNKNPDIFYYIEDDYIEELLKLLVEGVSKAIEENNKKLLNDLGSRF